MGTHEDIYPYPIRFAICENQGKVFEYAVQECYDAEDFVNKFMNSNFCKREWDAEYSPFQLWDECFTLENLLRETNITYKTKDYDSEVVLWIGYIYRMIYFKLDRMSAEIIRRLPFSTIYDLYDGFHTIDEDEACQIIEEDFFRKGA